LSVEIAGRDKQMQTPTSAVMTTISLPSQPKRVTLFEDRAEVLREAHGAVPTGRSKVLLMGVTPLIDDRSVQAKITGGSARLLSARVKRSISYQEVLGKEELGRLERTAKEKHLAAEAAAMTLERALLFWRSQEEAFRFWSDSLKKAFQAADTSQWEESYQHLTQSLEKAFAEVKAQEKNSLDAQEELEKANASLSEGQRREQRYQVSLELELESEASQVTLEVAYRTPCALWRPEHKARLLFDKSDPKRGELEITTFATAWQITGEVWDDVALVLSTARPARQAAPPLVQDDLIALRKKTDDERRNIYIEAREQNIANTGPERGARVLEEMPGVDDGGAPLQFSPAALVSLISDGRPFRVQIAKLTMPCVISRVLYPERAGVAHIKASATLQETMPLLAGPVRLARGVSHNDALVGRSRLAFVGAGEPFELGFGTDDGVRVRRQQHEQRDTVPVLGTQKLKRTIEIFLSNMSGETKALDIVERVPVSEFEEVEVLIVEEGNFRMDKDGLVRQHLKLHANETKQLRLVYEVRASSKVRMPF
jgi:uncharacterized protein (TIGR02231 family)